MNQSIIIILLLIAIFILLSVDKRRISKTRLLRNGTVLSSVLCGVTLIIWLVSLMCFNWKLSFPAGHKCYCEIGFFVGTVGIGVTRYDNTPVIVRHDPQNDPRSSNRWRDYSPPNGIQFFSRWVGLPEGYPRLFTCIVEEDNSLDDYRFKYLEIPYLLIAWIFALPLAVRGIRRKLTPPRQKSVFHWSVGILAGFCLLVVLFYAEENWRGRRAWENFRREWEAKGERFDWRSVVPPPVPEDQNFALTPVVYSSYRQELTGAGKAIPQEKWNSNSVNRLNMDVYFYYLQTQSLTNQPDIFYAAFRKLEQTNTFGSWAKGTRLDLKSFQQFYRALAGFTGDVKVLPQAQAPATDVLLTLGKFDSTIEELRAAAMLPFSRFPLKYDEDYWGNIRLPHLSVLKRCLQVLHLRAGAELQNGQNEKALDDVKLSLRLVDSIRNEPFVISHLVRASLLESALYPIYQGVSEHCWSDAQLLALEADLQKIDFLADSQAVMRGERAVAVANVNWLQRSRKNYSRIFGKSSESGTSRWIMANWGPSGWLEQNKIRICGYFTNLDAVVDLKTRTVHPEAARQRDPFLESESRRLTPYTYLESIIIPSLSAGIRKFAWTQTAADLARTACAMERYRLAHGGYPETLNALVPQFIAQVPHDVIGGQPLKYRRTDDGKFVLYSIGWNEKDDGGVIALKKDSTSIDIGNGDWVWKY